MDARLHITIDGHEVEMTTAGAADYIRGLNGKENQHEHSRLMARMKTGAALLEIRPQYRYGSWEDWLKLAGIDPRRANSAMRLAASLAGPDGSLDLQKCIAHGLATPLEGQEGHNRRNGADLLQQISLRQAELATGVRKGKGAESADDELEDPTQYDTPEQLEESIRVMREHREKREAERERNVMNGVTIDSQGLAPVQTKRLVGEEEVHRGQAVYAGPEEGAVVAGRIGPAELAPSRRPEAAGQMTFVGVFAGAEDRMVRASSLVGERRRRAEEAAARFNAEMDVILGEAPVGGA